MIKEEALVELKQIYFKNYGIILTNEQTLNLGIKLIELFKVIARPIPKVDINKSKDNNETNG